MNEPISTPLHVPRLAKSFVIWTMALLLLFFGFLYNLWGVADQNWFQYHQRDDESLILGRLVKSRQDGIFSAAGLTGSGAEHHVQEQGAQSEEIQVQYQYQAYLEKLTFNEYAPYLSQNGGQGMVFS